MGYVSIKDGRTPAPHIPDSIVLPEIISKNGMGLAKEITYYRGDLGYEEAIHRWMFLRGYAPNEDFLPGTQQENQVSLMSNPLHTALSEHPTIDSYISYLIEEDYHFRTNGQQVVVLGSSKSGHWGHAGRPGKRGGSVARSTAMSLKTSKDWKERQARAGKSVAESIVRAPSDKLKKSIDSRISDLAVLGFGRFGTSDKVEAAAMDNLHFIIDESDISIRTPPEAVMKILESGEFKNQHAQDVSESGGYFNPSARADVESNGFNVSRDASPEAYPIYGYLANNGITDINAVRHYGNVEFVLNPSIRSRTTITVGDSLGGELGMDVGASPINNPTKYSFDANVENLASGGRGRLPRIEYVETQIHGGVKLSDIAKVIVHVPPYKADMYVFTKEEEALSNHGIPYEIVEDGW